MTDEPEVTEETEEEYDPQPCILGDGDVLIEDPIALFEQTGSLAVQVRDGALFVLKRDTLKWINVEAAVKAAPIVMRSIPTKQ